jgi:putative phage-type endonuclease
MEDEAPPANLGDDIEAWVQARLGKVTASRVSDVLAMTKKGPSERRQHYMAELIAERLTGMPKEPFLNSAMLWGVETEYAARRAYENHSGESVEIVWFIDHPTIPMSGASPDGYVGDKGLLEIKCPLSQTLVEMHMAGEVPDKYVLQMQWQMACTGRRWCDFVGFDSRIKGPASLFVRRVDRDDAMIDEMEASVMAFLAEIDTWMDRLNRGDGL